MHQVLFTLGLSNGETIAEEKGNFQRIDGELSPWERAKRYIATEGVSITSFSLYTRDGRRWNLPSAAKNPKFKMIADAMVPVSFNFFRQAGIDVSAEGMQLETEIFAVAEARYQDGEVMQIWINDETMKSWVFNKKLS